MPSNRNPLRRLRTLCLVCGIGIAATANPLSDPSAQTPEPLALALDRPLMESIRQLERLAGGPMPALKARIVIVSFFASWCAPCVDEFAYLGGIYNAYGGDDPVIVAINLHETWAAGDHAARLARFIDRTKPLFTVVRGNAAIAEAFGGVREIPSLFVFARDGRLAYQFRNRPENAISDSTEAQLHAVLSKLL